MTLTNNTFGKLVCLFRGHSWDGGTFHILKEGVGLDRRYCGRCDKEYSVVE